MEFTLASLNIRFDNPADGVNAWPHRRLLVKEVLLKHSPDLIATQEGRYDQLKDLESLLSGFEIADHHRSWIKERMYPCLFVRSERFELLKSGDVWLSDTPDVAGSSSFNSTFPRLMTWARVQPRGGKQSFLLVNTHLDHVKPSTRVKQAEVLCREIKKIKENSILIVMGDFNDSPESSVREVITQHFTGLQDAWKIFNSKEESSHHTFHGESEKGSRIDWILTDERIQVKACELDKSRSDGRFPSDHYPVICRINT